MGVPTQPAKLPRCSELFGQTADGFHVSLLHKMHFETGGFLPSPTLGRLLQGLEASDFSQGASAVQRSPSICLWERDIRSGSIKSLQSRRAQSRIL